MAYHKLAVDALEKLGTAGLPSITKWIKSERQDVDFKPHLLKAALKKAIEKGAPPQARVCRSSRASRPLFSARASRPLFSHRHHHQGQGLLQDRMGWKGRRGSESSCNQPWGRARPLPIHD